MRSQRSSQGDLAMQHPTRATMVLFALVAGCASTPPAPVAPPSVVASPAVEPAPAAAAGAVAGDAADPAAAHQKLVREARVAGFSVSTPQPGSYVFCTDGSPTGSRVAARTCLSEAQMQDWLVRHRNTRDDVQRSLGCGGSGCANRPQ
jgi:hypothetical protein